MFGRKDGNFFYWIGFRKLKIKNPRKFYSVIILMTLLSSVVLFFIFPKFIGSSKVAISEFKGKGMKVLFSVLCFSFIKTGLAEEIFFRSCVKNLAMS
jgi:membrane protease YdiL (CAAX protease family)